MYREILNPDLYHGHKKKKNFFEGWYFKISDKNMENILAFIPGIFMGKDKTNCHSFIQMVNGGDIHYQYMQYSVEAFKASKDSFDIQINNSKFSISEMVLNINEPETQVKGKILFHNIKKWPDTLINPGSMGFYNYFSFMECYSQVCVMDMQLSGSLTINGKEMSFDGGRGYIEKNWGKAFPYSWIWVQGNQFSKNTASLSCSIGHIPFPLGSFRGFLVGLLVKDDFYKFTTMNRSKLKIKQMGADVEMELVNKSHKLCISVTTEIDKFMTLKGPRDNKMIPLVDETLKGIVEVQLTSLKDNTVIFHDITKGAGVEYGGEQMLIRD